MNAIQINDERSAPCSDALRGESVCLLNKEQVTDLPYTLPRVRLKKCSHNTLTLRDKVQALYAAIFRVSFFA